ncbi:MAG TPA: hypothetical protein VLT62_06550 [Candidatus Methylomirabilis sp.]|nr:hypothetical protein [Candidatus Methylomirabilis sp.]
MGTEVSIRDVGEAIELQGDERTAYLNPDTGEIVTVSEEERRLVKEGTEEDVPEWQRELLPKVREALASERFLPLPTRFEVHDWSIMEQFAEARTDAGERDAFRRAIHGPGAFRRFRDTAQRLGLEQEWFRFHDAALASIAREWLEAHGIAYRSLSTHSE